MSTLLLQSVEVAPALKQHAAAIEDLRARCAAELAVAEGADALALAALPAGTDPAAVPAVPYDDLFLLRFLLSHNLVPSTAEPFLRDALLWRAAHAPLLLLRRAGLAQPPHQSIVSPYSIQGDHGRAKDGSPLFVVRSGLANLGGMMELSNPHMVADWMLLMREPDWAQCDRATRDAGRLVKMLSVIDFNHSSITHSMNLQFFKALGISSKASEKIYPQLLGTTTMLNPPGFMAAFMKLGRTFMSQKTLEKVRICPGRTLKEDVAACPFAGRAFERAGVPTFMGGGCDHAGKGCIQRCPNSADRMVKPEVDLHAAVAGFEKEHGGAVESEAERTVRGRRWRFRKVTVPAKGPVAIDLGAFPAGAAAEFACWLPRPEREGGVRLSLHSGPRTPLEERRVRVYDAAACWADGPGGEIRLENEGKRERVVVVGWCVVAREEFLAAAEAKAGKGEREAGERGSEETAAVDAVAEGLAKVSV
ncbi:CRAL-TRIO domain-containing protein [Hyaloraphidium curvatum]|nr:CRAL-TRIO domain-containing protein [Hyaloraphidium curvatum]